MLSNTSFLYLSTNQKKLDNYILNKFKLIDQKTLEKRILAFLVELGEFINEQRDFKYWSIKPASEEDILLEEYIDGIHFLISIGNTLKVNYEDYQYKNKDSNKNIDLTKIFLNCYVVAEKLIKDPNETHYFEVLTAYLSIAEALNFNEEALLTAYNRKNEINFNRQDNNY